MKSIKIIQYFLFFIIHFNIFCATKVLFSNNSPTVFTVTSEFSDELNELSGDHDFNLAQQSIVDSFLSNVNILNFDPAKTDDGREYHFRISILNQQNSYQLMNVDFTIKKSSNEYKIVNANLSLPFESINIDLASFSSLNLSHYWPDFIVRFVPSSVSQKGVKWPSFTIVIDKQNHEDISFDNSAHNSFKIINYNTQIWPFYGDIKVPPNNKIIRAHNIPKLIGNSFDFVSLNEVFDASIRSQIKKDMTKNYPYFVDVAGLDAINVLSSGVIVFSKWPIVASKQHIYKNCYDIECFGTKGITYVKIIKNVDGKEQNYNIFATHLQSSKPSNENTPSKLPRQKQLNELAAFIKAQHIPASEPVLIAGDFNVDAFDFDQKNYNNMFLQTEYEFMLSVLNSSDAEQSGLIYSFDYLLNTMLALSESKERSKIDYILYANDYVKPIYSKNRVITLRDTTTQNMYPNYDTSDHFPIIGEFVF